MDRINQSFLRLFKVWLHGLKVFCGYVAFTICLCVLYLPVAWIVDTVGTTCGVVLGFIVFVMAFPFLFSGVSRYLHVMEK